MQKNLDVFCNIWDLTANHNLLKSRDGFLAIIILQIFYFDLNFLLLIVSDCEKNICAANRKGWKERKNSIFMLPLPRQACTLPKLDKGHRKCKSHWQTQRIPTVRSIFSVEPKSIVFRANWGSSSISSDQLGCHSCITKVSRRSRMKSQRSVPRSILWWRHKRIGKTFWPIGFIMN